MAKQIQFADAFQPDFGIPWVPVPTDAEFARMTDQEVERIVLARQKIEVAGAANPVGFGWTLPAWEAVKRNWRKYNVHILLGGNQSGKSIFGSRLSLSMCAMIPEAEIYSFHISEKRSIDDAQRFIYEALPDSIRNIPTKKGVAYNLQYTQKNGFTDGICILPPLPGYRRGGSIKFYNYAQYQQNTQIIEGIKPHMIWCIAGGELVQMANGTLKQIEDVRPGDTVLSLNGAGRIVKGLVTATQNNGEKDCVMLKPRNGTPIICTPDHDIFWGYFYESKKPAATADRIAQVRPGWWPKITESRTDAWYAWMGLVVSEGCVAQKKITSGSEEAVGRATKLLPPHASVKRFKSPNAAVADWFLRWPEFWSEVKPQVSETKEIPDWIFTSPKKKVRIFLRWLYQGDGWACDHRVGYASTSYKLAYQLTVLLGRMGIRASFSVRKSKNINWRDQYWVNISKAADVIKFVDEIGIEDKEEATARVRIEAERRIKSSSGRSDHLVIHGRRDKKWLDRKSETRLKSSRISKKIEIGPRQVYDITVEGEHRFLCGTSLVSNCDEKVPFDLFETLRMGRLGTHHGRLLLTYTVVDGWNDTIEKILARRKTIESRFCDHPKIMANLPIMEESLSVGSCAIYYAWTQDNPFTDVKEFYKQYGNESKEIILARAFGVPTKSVASAFPLFSKEYAKDGGNVVKHEELPWLNLKKNAKGVEIPYKTTRYMAIDLGGSKNWCMLWVAIDPAGTWWVYREWPDISHGEWALPGDKEGPAQKSLGLDIKGYVELIRGYEAGEDIFERYIDPRMGAAEKQSKDRGAVTIISDLDECGMPVIPAPAAPSEADRGEIEDGIQLISNLLYWDQKKPQSVMNAPKLYVSDRCQNLIYSLQEYTGRLGAKEHTKDMVDCLRYLRKGNCEYVDKNFKDNNRTGVY